MGGSRQNLRLDLQSSVGCYLLGAFLGDGSVSHGRRLAYTVGKDDATYADAIAAALSEAGLPVKRMVKSDGVHVVYVNSVTLVEQLEWWKRKGRWFDAGDVGDMRALVAGVVDTDGHVEQSSARIDVTQKIRNNLKWLAHMMAKHGADAASLNIERGKKGSWRLRVTGASNLAWVADSGMRSWRKFVVLSRKMEV